MPFLPGNRANPSGRARKTKSQMEFERRCQEYLDKKGWPALEAMAQEKDVKVRQWAIQTMLDRGYGKPMEVVDVTTRDESAHSPDQLAESIAELIAGEAGAGAAYPLAGAGDGRAGAAPLLPTEPGSEAIH